ncbi:MAG: helix-turn-helix domain-containing protein [Elusimicrobia bacterium]|nr:helix-turn-helix domain-containing protein [Elusimicrobiota bacterium]
MQMKIVVMAKASRSYERMKKFFQKEKVSLVRAATAAQVYPQAMKHFPDAILLVGEPESQTGEVKALAEKLDKTSRLSFIPLFCLCREGSIEHRKAALGLGIDCLGPGLDTASILFFIKGKISLYRKRSALKAGSIALDPQADALWADHGMRKSKYLTPEISRFLYLLAAHMNEVVSDQEVQRHLGIPSTGLRMLLSRVRQAIPAHLRNAVYVDRVPGQGFRIIIS